MDPVLGGLIVTVLTLVARELRWHAVHRKQQRKLEKANNVINSLRPPEMPPWDSDSDSDAG